MGISTFEAAGLAGAFAADFFDATSTSFFSCAQRAPDTSASNTKATSERIIFSLTCYLRKYRVFRRMENCLVKFFYGLGRVPASLGRTAGATALDPNLPNPASQR